MRRWLRRILFFVVCLVLVLAVAWTAWNFSASRRLAAVLEELRADGLPTALSELSPDPAPASENAAPYYRAAFALLGTVDVTVDDPLDLSDEARRQLPRFDPALELVHRAAAMPRCDFGLAYEKGFHMEVDHLGDMRRVATVLAARAAERARAGEVDGALEDLRVLFRVSRALREDSILISQLVRFAIARQGLRVLENVLPQLDSAAKRLAEVDPDSGRGAIAAGLRVEMACWPVLLTPGVLEELDAGEGPNWWSFDTIAAPYLKADLAFWLETMLRAYRELTGPYAKVLETLKGLEGEAARDGGMITALMTSPILSSVRQEAVLASHVAMARLAAEILDHRRREGALPSSLEALGPQVDRLDPLTGKPFVLERAAGNVVLVSQERGAVETDDLRWVLPPE